MEAPAAAEVEEAEDRSILGTHQEAAAEAGIQAAVAEVGTQAAVAEVDRALQSLNFNNQKSKSLAIA